MTLTEVFLKTCEDYADKTAIVDEGESEISYAALGTAAKSGAEFLGSATPKDKVGILLPNCKEFVISYFAILLSGKIPVPINSIVPPRELRYIVSDADLDTILTTKFFKELVGGNVENPVYLEDAPRPAATVDAELPRAKKDDLVTLLYTSGTTANPKGVMLSHNNILSNLDGCMKACYFDEHDVILGVLPLFHAFGLTTTLALPIKMGATAIYLKRFSAVKTARLIEKYRVTALLMITSMYRVLLRSSELEKRDLSSVRLALCGGEPLPTEVVDEFEKPFGIPLLEGYGLTETSPVASINRPDAHKKGTAGLPIPDVEVQIVDEAETPLPPNQDGEIWIRGSNIMKGYYNDPAETAEAITPDGWFKTGDIGRLDEDGFLSITGRKKELIISGGENISPNEIENVISRHPKVFEAAVVGAPDKSRGEVPKAYIVLHPDQTCTAEEMKEFCRGRLAAFKIPRYFELRDELPHGTTGKVLKRALK